MISYNWRNIYILSIIARFIVALSNSYIHPDEHFQNFEVLANSILGYTTHIPWEFTSESPARSLGPLYIVYGPMLYLLKVSGAQFTPIQIWYIFRLQFLALTWIFTDYCIQRILPTRPERIKGFFFISTSYVTMVYQSHCFSNSIETLLVLFAIYLIEDLRFYTKEHEKNLDKNYLNLGIIISFGIFNRITFPAFLILPSFFILNHLRYSNKKLKSVLYGSLGFFVTSAVMISIDTFGFGSSEQIKKVIEEPLNIHNYIVTPWNSLVYNTNASNLAKHGIHPFYTHVLVNLPQLLGPAGLIFLVYRRNKYWKTTPFLGLVSGLVFLSVVPHQELRFLIPIVPLACCCFDLEKFSPPVAEAKTSAKPKDQSEEEKEEPPSEQSSKVTFVLMLVWYLFNIVLTVLMGVYHQGGVVPVLDYFQTKLSSNETIPTAQIWWRTYSPPTWLLGNQDSSLKVYTTTSEEPVSEIKALTHTKSHLLLDTMGSDYSYIQELAKSLKAQGYANVYLVTPVGTFLTTVPDTNKYKQDWSYSNHLDLDHLDFDNLKSLTPGLGVYELI